MSSYDDKVNKAIENNTLTNGDIVTLSRKTRSMIQNENGYLYTKEAFEEAIKFYNTYRGGGVYLSPVCIDEFNVHNIMKVRDINTKVYRDFHHPKISEEYRVGTITEWDDFTISFKISSTDISGKFLKYIIPETKINMRYDVLCHALVDIPITKMGIIAFDLAVIPFKELGIDISEF